MDFYGFWWLWVVFRPLVILIDVSHVQVFTVSYPIFEYTPKGICLLGTVLRAPYLSREGILFTGPYFNRTLQLSAFGLW